MDAQVLPFLLATCEAEPICIPGRIQSFGALMAIDEGGIVRQASTSFQDHFNVPAEKLIGRHYLHFDILGRSASASAIDWSLEVSSGPTAIAPWDWQCHRCGGVRIIELIPASIGPAALDDGELAMHLARGTEVVPFAEAVCRKIKDGAGFDRVLLYRFDPEWNGEVIAESRNAEQPPYLGLHYPASDIPAQARELYRVNRMRFLADVAAASSPIVPIENPATGQPLDLSNALLRDPSPVHREYLSYMGVRCTLVVSVIDDTGKLWGLIACHHSEPRAWHADWGRLCLTSSNLIAAALALTEARSRARVSEFAQQLLRALPRFFEGNANLGEGLVHADSGLMEFLDADGLAVLHRNRQFTRGIVPDADWLQRLVEWLDTRGESPFATDGLGKLIPDFADRPEAAGLLALHIPSSLQGWVMWFRGERSRSITWAGDPRKAIVADENQPARLCPRKSFDAWVEIVRGRSRPWSTADLAKASEVIRPNLLEVMALAYQKQFEILHRYQSILFDQVHDAIIVTDLDGVVTFWNEGATRTLGWTATEVVGKHILERIPPEDRASASALMAQVQDGKSFAGRYRDTHKLGHTVWLDVRLSRIHDEQGRYIGIMGASRDVTAEKENYDRLRLKQAIVRQSRDNIIVTEAEPIDTPGPRIVYVSPSLIADTGYSEAELLGKTPRIFQGPKTDRAVLDRIRRALKSWKPCREELINYRKDGSECWIELDISPLADEKGWYTHWVAIQRDISDRKAAEQKLREREEQFRLLAENLPDPVFVVDPESDDPPLKILYCSPAVEQSHGYTTGELIGRSITTIIDAGDVEYVPERIAKLEGGKSITFNERHRRKDGAVLHAEIRVVKIQWQGRSVLLGIDRDITERLQAEAALRANEEFLKAIVDGNPECIKVLDAAGTVLRMNAAGLKMLGATENQVIGASAFDVIAPSDRDRYITFHEAVMAGASGSLEFDVVRSDGTRRRLECQAVPLISRGQRVHLALSLDITDRRRMEEQIRQAQKLEALGQLAGGIAHDFNNLLMIVKGTSELLLLDMPSDDPRRELVESVYRAGERGAGLTRQLLAFSRREMVQIEVFDPGMVVRESLKMLDRLLGEDIDLQYFAALEIGKLRGDPGQFEQILMNLVVNARDAMPQGGPIHVTLDRRRLQDEHRQGDYIRLCVKDGGIGIPPEVRDKLFEPFFTTKPQGRGTGLGLATVYGIVQQFHGFIEFESEVGRGSVFQVYFPRYPDPNEPAASDLRGKTASTTGSETILLVEDDTAVRALTQSLLTRAGYRVLAAESAEAALALFEELPEPPNIVVTDVVMPGMSGKALADAITLRHPGMKFLFLSGYTNDRTFAYGLNRETSAFLQKPVSPGELGRAVRRLLDDQN